jgi:hypothetical protein
VSVDPVNYPRWQPLLKMPFFPLSIISNFWYLIQLIYIFWNNIDIFKTSSEPLNEMKQNYVTLFEHHTIYTWYWSFFLLWYWLAQAMDSNWKLYVFHHQFSIILQIFKLLTNVGMWWGKQTQYWKGPPKDACIQILFHFIQWFWGSFKDINVISKYVY